jgi:hypothetical protein
MSHGVFFTEIIEQGGERRQTVADDAAATRRVDQAIAWRDDLSAGHGTERRESQLC